MPESVDYPDFSERYYREKNPDVANAIRAGTFAWGWAHFAAFGWKENRPYSPTGKNGLPSEAKPRPKVCIGMFLCNEEKQVHKAIESLLAQTWSDFRLIILDDCSTDSTPDIVERYAVKDPRISFIKNTRRMGYAANYRITFNHADPDTDYFAWAAGHDMHHSYWLEAMVRQFEQNPDIVMAYCASVRIDENDVMINFPCPRYDTSGLDISARIDSLHDGAGFGNMIYGLFRAPALCSSGIFPQHLFPDVLLFSRLTLLGGFRMVSDVLWFRRYASTYSSAVPDRQRRIAFARAPWYAYLPWPICHYIYLFYHTVLGPRAGSWRMRRLGLKLCRAYRKRFFHKIRTSSAYYEKLFKWCELRRARLFRYKTLSPQNKQ